MGARQERFGDTMDEEGSISYNYEGRDYRFRGHVAKDRRGTFLALRLIPAEPISVEKLGWPNDAVWRDILNLSGGLVLVTGVTGSGKSTTLASLIQKYNELKPAHIITFEDPVEYRLREVQGIISQREVGVDVVSFQEGLRGAMRLDPDVLYIGEIRDLQTAQIALTASETGHLVFSTLHNRSAGESIEKFVNFYEWQHQASIRQYLSVNLAYVIVQQLLPYQRRPDRVLAMEVMNVKDSTAIQNVIRKGEINKIHDEIERGNRYNMITMDQHLVRLCKEGKVSSEDAIHHAFNQEYMRSRIMNQ